MENENVDLLAKTDKFVVLPINKNINDIIEDVTINKISKHLSAVDKHLVGLPIFRNEPIGEVDLIAKNDVDKKVHYQNITSVPTPPRALVVLICMFLLWQYLLHI